MRGGYNPQATEVWQEALRIPPIKVYEKGRLRKDVWDLIFANIRLRMVEEDLKAQIGSCVVGERSIQSIVEKYGLDVFEAHKEYLFDATEKMMRAEVRSIPNGVYTGEAAGYSPTTPPVFGSFIPSLMTIPATKGVTGPRQAMAVRCILLAARKSLWSPVLSTPTGRRSRVARSTWPAAR